MSEIEAAGPSVTQFRILGPLEAESDGRIIPVLAPRQQALLAVLVLEARHIIPVSRLVDAVWDEAPPATARSQIHICISSLRKLIGDSGAEGSIVTRSPGYHLRVTENQVDAVLFEKLLADARSAIADGRPSDAVRDLRLGLDLWRGPAAAGIESRIVQTAATRLNELRLTAIEAYLGLEIQLGNHAEVIGELTALVVEHPLREKLRAHHMLALYLSGRQADALGSYQAARQVFIQELGLEPGEELRRLERAVLDSDPNLGPNRKARLAPLTRNIRRPTIVPCQLPADIADLVGRAKSSEQVREWLIPAPGKPDQTRPVRVAVLTGMAGVGKTAIAVHIAHTLRNHFPDGQLFLKMRGPDTRPAATEQLLARSLRSLGIATPGEVPSHQDELAEIYRSVLAPRRVLIMLDDATSVAQVTPLLPGSGSCAVIVTSRLRLSALMNAQIFELGLLPEDVAINFLARNLSDTMPVAEREDIASVAKLCGYLPLALRIIVSRFREHPHWTLKQVIRRLEDEKNRLAELQTEDVGITDSVSLSYESLSSEAKRLFLRLGLLGPVEFAPWVSAPLTGIDAKHGSDLVDQLVASRLVEARRGSNGLTKFYLHDLVRAFAVQRLTADEKIG